MQTEAGAADQIIAVFRKFDENGDEKISTHQSAELVKSLDLANWSDEKISTLLAAATEDQEGSIQYEQFVDWIWGRKYSKAAAKAISTRPLPFCCCCWSPVCGGEIQDC